LLGKRGKGPQSREIVSKQPVIEHNYGMSEDWTKRLKEDNVMKRILPGTRLMVKKEYA
jgi:hypothetical protein